MKSFKPPFGNRKSLAVLVSLAGLILISGFVATQALLLPGKSKGSPVGRNVNASSINQSGEEITSNPDENHTQSDVNADRRGTTSGNPNITVWVNTSSGVYHCPNTRWYGNTKNGKYMTQQEAQSKGYRPAYGSACG